MTGRNRFAERDIEDRLDRLRSLNLPGEVFSGDLARWMDSTRTWDEVLAWWKALLQERERQEAPDRIQLYLHVPFCSSKCRFCQFDSVPLPDRDAIEVFLVELERLTARFREVLGPLRVSCVSVGGGTPSLLDQRQVSRAMRCLFEDLVILPSGAFFSVEMNPESVSPGAVAAFATAGANRFSLGVQSLSREVLRRAGRPYSGAARIGEAIRSIRAVGSAWVNLDLLAPLAAETADSIREAIATLLALEPDSLTLYRYQPVHRNGRIVSPGALSFETASALLLELAASAAFRETLITRTSTIVMQRVPPWAADRYEHHPDRPGSLLGLGPFSESHVFGHGLYRTDFSRDGRWSCRGLPLERGDEARWELARCLARNRPVPREEFRSRLGCDPVAVAPEVFRFLGDRGQVEVRPDRIQPRIPDQREAALLAGLVLDDVTLDRIASLVRSRAREPNGR